jgi:hypothetical protein
MCRGFVPFERKNGVVHNIRVGVRANTEQFQGLIKHLMMPPNVHDRRSPSGLPQEVLDDKRHVDDSRSPANYAWVK